MLQRLHILTEQFAQALKYYLASETELALMDAYECGRSAIADGLGVLDMSSIYHNALNPILATIDDSEHMIAAIHAANVFFRESLSPFEMTHRGYRETNEGLHRVIETLNHRTTELAAALKDKKDAEELLKAQEKYRFLVEATHAALISTDKRGRIMYVNGEGAQILGYTPDELIGKFSLRFVHPDDRTAVQSFFLKQISTLTPRSSIEFRYAGRRGKDGWFSFSSSLLYDEKNNVAGLTGAALEITDRKIAEASVIQNQDRFQALVENSTDGIFLTDPQGTILYVSSSTERLLGYSTNELLLTHWFEFIHPDDRESTEHFHTDLIRYPKKSQTVQCRIKSKRGIWKWVESVGSNLLEEPYVRSIVINYRDITTQKLAEGKLRGLTEELERRVVERTAQLETANKQLEAFSYSVSHDLRAPLRALDGFTRILLSEYASQFDNRGKQYLDIIQNNVRKMGQLIDDLLAFSRLGRIELEKATIDVNTLANSVAEELQRSESGRSITLSISPLPPAWGSSAMMRQVFVNLISNAIKFTRPRATAIIEIGGEQRGRENVYYVKDNGVGFNMRYVDRLFTVFQRLHSADEFEGTGVGLAIVQRVIQRHGGSVWAEAEVNNGATIFFTLPHDVRS